MVSHEELLVVMTTLILGGLIIETALIVWGIRSVNRMFMQVAVKTRPEGFKGKVSLTRVMDYLKQQKGRTESMMR